MTSLSKELVVSMLQKMLEIRFFEETVFNLYDQNLVPAMIHLYVGEEAIAVARVVLNEKSIIKEVKEVV